MQLRKIERKSKEGKNETTQERRERLQEEGKKRYKQKMEQ
jgi:hypothetical protein